MAEALSRADAAWLHMEEPTNHFAVTSLLLLDDRLELDQLREALRRRLPALPLLTRRAVEDGRPLGSPPLGARPQLRAGRPPAPGGAARVRRPRRAGGADRRPDRPARGPPAAALADVPGRGLRGRQRGDHAPAPLPRRRRRAGAAAARADRRAPGRLAGVPAAGQPAASERAIGGAGDQSSARSGGRSSPHGGGAACWRTRRRYAGPARAARPRPADAAAFGARGTEGRGVVSAASDASRAPRLPGDGNDGERRGGQRGRRRPRGVPGGPRQARPAPPRHGTGRRAAARAARSSRATGSAWCSWSCRWGSGTHANG
jgi:hypothetical protein